MFIILTYDVHRKRVGKILKVCRRYLRHVQKSVFDGEITQSKLKKLKGELSDIVDTSYDSVQIYVFESVRFAHRECLGQVTVIDGLL